MATEQVLCSRCENKQRPVIFSLTQQQTKDTSRTVGLCAPCLNYMVLNMVSWNSDLQNKIFNWINLVPFGQ